MKYNKNKKSGFTVVEVILVIIIVIILGFIGWRAYTSGGMTGDTTKNSSPAAVTAPAPAKKDTPVQLPVKKPEVPMSNYETSAYSFQYPSSWGEIKVTNKDRYGFSLEPYAHIVVYLNDQYPDYATTYTSLVNDLPVLKKAVVVTNVSPIVAVIDSDYGNQLVDYYGAQKYGNDQIVITDARTPAAVSGCLSNLNDKGEIIPDTRVSLQCYSDEERQGFSNALASLKVN